MKKLVLFALLMCAPLASQALIEVRAGYGINTPDDDNQNGNDIKVMKGLNADIIFEPPVLLDLGIGLRYEIMSQDFTNAFGSGTADMDRLSLLVNYHFIDTLVYIGVIGTYGLNTDFKAKQGGTELTFKDKANYSIGAEAGVHLGLLRVGAEVGKFFGKFENSGVTTEVDSLYAKVLVGVGF